MNQRMFRGDWVSHEVPTTLQESGQLESDSLKEVQSRFGECGSYVEGCLRIFFLYGKGTRVLPLKGGKQK